MLSVRLMKRRTESILECSLLVSSPMISVKGTNLQLHHDCILYSNVLHRQEAGPRGSVSVWPTPTAILLEDTEVVPMPRGSESVVSSSRQTVGPRCGRTSPTYKTQATPPVTLPRPTQIVFIM